MEQVNIQIPEGHEIDLEKSNLAEGKIVFKKKKATPWRYTNPTVQGFYVTCLISGITETSGPCPWHKGNENVFATKKQAKSMLAMAQLSQIIANDERFGGPITKEEWKDATVCKRLIIRQGNRIVTDYSYGNYYFLAFHTVSQQDLFLAENEDLIKQYYMLD